jgi:signal peptidase I
MLLGLMPFAIGGGGAVAVRAASLWVYMVPSGSMSSTLTAGDRVRADQFVGQKPKRGAI